MGAVGLALSLGVALVALPFIRLMLWRRGAGRKEMRLAGNVFLGVLGVGVLPFFLWGPHALWLPLTVWLLIAQRRASELAYLGLAPALAVPSTLRLLRAPAEEPS